MLGALAHSIEEINPVVSSQNLPLRESAYIRDTRVNQHDTRILHGDSVPSSLDSDVTWRELAVMHHDACLKVDSVSAFGLPSASKIDALT